MHIAVLPPNQPDTTSWRPPVERRQRRRVFKAVYQIAGLFAVTILIPVFLLSGLAWSSIQSEELSIDEGLRSDAKLAIAKLQEDHTLDVQRFEARVREHLNRGTLMTAPLNTFSPHARLVLELDATGSPIRPYAVDATPTEFSIPSARFLKRYKQAVQFEQNGNVEQASLEFLAAQELARADSDLADASIGRIRTLAAAGRHQQARVVAQDLARSRLSDVRDSRGHRVRDTATFLAARSTLILQPKEGVQDLKDFAESLLSRTWSIGYGGEPALTIRTIQTLGEQATSASWNDAAMRQIVARTEALKWANTLDISRISPPPQLQPNAFSYQESRDGRRPSLWVYTRHEGKTYALSLDMRSMEIEIVQRAQGLHKLSQNLQIDVLHSYQEPHESTILTGAIGAYLTSLRLAVRPHSVDALAARKEVTRFRRRSVISIALLVLVLGIFLSTRMISREMHAAHMKTDFAANVSHELRSPITQIRLKAESLQLDLVRDEEDRVAHYHAIVHESERLSRLVDNILDFAAIERGAKRYQLRPEDLIEVVANTCTAMRGPLAQRDMVLDIDLPDHLPRVWIDREAIKQVLINLLSNAAKYGQEGKWVGVRIRMGIDGVDLSISDRGLGISPEDQELIFDDFYRSSNYTVRSKKGTGIGLSIVKYIVEAHGGTISVDSYLGKGATFTFTLPVTPPTGLGVRN